MRILVRVLSIALACLSTRLTAASDAYVAHVESERAERLKELTKPDGWLSLIGLHFLNPGENTVGSAPGNQVVLAAGPAQLGTVIVSATGALSFLPDKAAAVTVDGKSVDKAELRPAGSGEKPTLVRAGTVSFFVIERGGRPALRVRDSASDRLTHFVGLDYFATDPSWRIVAKWVPFTPPRKVPITNVLGNVSEETVPGKAVFERDGKTYELLPLSESPAEPLFFILSDATSGKETYRMRFLGADQPSDGTVVLDFNLAENPPCGFTPFATCPLPPKENRLSLAITAGEKVYRGEHE